MVFVILFIISLFGCTPSLSNHFCSEDSSFHYNNSTSNLVSECADQTSSLQQNTKDEDGDRSSTLLYLNQQHTDYFTSPYQSISFDYTSNDRNYLSLNYSGPSASLKIFYSNYEGANDYLTFSSNVLTSPDLYFFDKDVKYTLRFTVTQFINYSTPFSIELNTIQANHTYLERYVLHVTYGNYTHNYRYKVEYFNVSYDSYTPLNGNIVHNGQSNSYLDIIDNSLNFGVNPDNRRMISNTGYYEHSSEAGMLSSTIYNHSLHYYDGTEHIDTVPCSSTFVSETTVITAAHCVYRDINSNGIMNTSTICYNIKFYPAINSYNGENLSNSVYGEYTATNAYLPIGFVVDQTNYSSYDWAIVLTDNTRLGTMTHSYMGVGRAGNFYSVDEDGNGLTDFYQMDQVRFISYPALSVCPLNLRPYYIYTMWTSYSVSGSIMVDQLINNTFYSYHHRSSGGSSGGGYYTKIVTYSNGQMVVFASLIGVHSGSAYKNGSRITKACRLSIPTINIISEVIEYD